MAPKKAPKKENKKDKSEKDEKKDDGETKADIITEQPDQQIPPPTLSANIIHVNFTSPSPKNIISKHSGSILSDEEPRISLNAQQEEKARKIFSTLASQETINNETVFKILKSKVPTAWSDFGFHFEKSDIEKIVHRFLPIEDSQIDNKEKEKIDPKKKTGTQIPNKHASVAQVEQPLISTDYLDEVEYLNFLSKFFTPSFHYGQRLRLYCSRGEIDKAIELIIRGCNVNTQDGMGLASLHYASELNQTQIISEIYRITSPPNVPSTSPLALNLNITDKCGWTPLHCASHHGAREALN